MTMELTQDTLVYELWELIRKNITDDDSIDYRQIAEWITQQRAFWIKRQTNNRMGLVDNAFYQNLPKMELEEINSIEDTSIACSGYIKRTKLSVPRIIEGKTGYLVRRIGPIDNLSERFKVKDITELIYLNNGRFNNTALFAIFDKGKANIVSTSTNPYYGALKYISVDAVFENPEQLEDYIDKDGNSLFDKSTTPYPITRDLYLYMKEAVIKFNIPLIKQADEDPLNNAINDEQQR
jgi:hypothetical protein